MRRFSRPVLVACIVALVVLGAVGWGRAISLDNSSAASNAAVVDAELTATLVSTISRDLSQVLSYDYSDPGPTDAAAERVLTGAARKEHATLFAELRKKAPGQNLVLSAEVQASGVVEIDGNRAKMLVFLDQTSRRDGDEEATVSAAQLSVSAVRVSGEWKISGLRPL